MIIFTRSKVGIITISLLVAALMWAPVVDAAPKDSAGKSDLNNDGAVDYADLVIFSSDYLSENVETFDWCAFVDATSLEAQLYGRSPSYYTKHFSELLSFISSTICERSDLNDDGRINIRDLMGFSEEFAGKHFMGVDWCAFLDSVLEGDDQFDKPADFYLNQYGPLLLFIQDKYTCSDTPPPPPPGDPLALKNTPKFLTRIAASGNIDGDYYVTDAKVGSVFIYDSNLVLTQELKDLATPIGIAVNSSGHILVGNDKRNNVEVYDPDNGALLSSFGDTELEMPTSIRLDSQGNVYVTDSRSNTIYVYDSNYNLITNIGEPGQDLHEIRSPGTTVLSLDESELFVLDRLNKRIQVYDIDGNFLRSVPLIAESCGWFGCALGTARFTRIQDLDIDANGKLHVLDIFDAVVAIIDPQTGVILGKYGSYGLSDGELKSPTGLLRESNRTLVLDAGKSKIEVFTQ